MFRSVQMVLGGLFVVLWGLSRLSRQFPETAWLQVFRYDPPALSEEHKARMRRRANIYAGFEMILLGVAIPMGYAVLTVMFFNSFTPIAMVLVIAGSLLCIGLGVMAIVRNRR